LLNDDTHNLNPIINKYKTNISHLKKYYTLIVCSFLFSYLNNLFLKIFFEDSSKCFTEVINIKDNSTSLGNIRNFYGVFDFIFSIFFLLCIRIIPHLAVYYGLIQKKPEVGCKYSIFIQL